MTDNNIKYYYYQYIWSILFAGGCNNIINLLPSEEEEIHYCLFSDIAAGCTDWAYPQREEENKKRNDVDKIKVIVSFGVLKWFYEQLKI